MNTQMLSAAGPIRFVGSFTGAVAGVRYSPLTGPRAPGVTASVPAKSGPPLQVTLAWRRTGDGAIDIDIDIDGRRFFSGLRDSSAIAEPKLRATVEMLVAEIRYQAQLDRTNGPFDAARLEQLGAAVLPAVTAFRQIRGTADPTTVEERL